MPGIAGIIRKQLYDGVEQDLGLMVESMKHEANYVSGQYTSAKLGIALGWTSHPWSLSHCMPLVSPDGRFVLVATGECFPDPDGTEPTRDAGTPEANSRDLLRLCREDGDKFLARLNGWFSGIVIDLAAGKATLFNDRYAMSRVYFYEGKEEFVFASEAKAILRIRPVVREIDPTSLAMYLRFLCVTGNRSLFKDISLLPPASSWIFEAHSTPRKQSYFDFAQWEKQQPLAHDEFFEEFESTASRVIPPYRGGTEPVAMSLTAGLDTRAILAAAAKQDQPLPCYTFGGLWGETFDIQMARKLAEICNQSHAVIRIDEKFLRGFSEYAQKNVYISDGTHDAFGAHDVYFNEIAKNIAPVRLTGKFGSEVVRSKRLIPNVDFPKYLMQPSFAPLLDEVLTIATHGKMSNSLTRAVTEDIPWYEYGRVSVEQSALTLRTPYMDNALVKLMYRAPEGVRLSRELQVRYIKDQFPELANVPTDMGKPRKNGEPPGKLAHGFYWALAKAEYIYLYSMPHSLTWVDRKLRWLHPERALVGRQKFEAYRIWTTTYFAESIREILLNPQARCSEFFDKAWVRKVVERHTAGTHNYLYELNRMLTVELIYSTLLKV